MNLSAARRIIRDMNRRTSPWAAAAVLSLGVAVAASGSDSATRPTTGPATAPAVAKGPPATLPALAKDSPSTRPVGAAGSSPAATVPPPAWASQIQLAILGSRAIHELEGRQFDAARASLTQALAIDPHEPTDLYNLACLDALTGHPAEAGGMLRLAAEDGFDEFAHMADDADLASIRDTAAFRDVIAHQGRYQHMAAERAEDALRARFGPGYIYEIDDADKLIFATNTDRRTLQALKSDMVRQARSQWKTLFARHFQQYVSVVIPSAADYVKVRPNPNVGGFYTPATHTLISSGLGLVTTHEFTHALNFGDIEGTGEEQPIWLTEGLAVLFEGAQFKGDVLTPQPNQRLYELLVLRHHGKLIAFDRLLRMKQGTFLRNAGPCYAESGGIMAYLYDQGQLRPFYDAYKAGYAKDPTGRAALEAVLKKPIADVQKDWEAWLTRQPLPPLFTGDKGAFIGARFDQGNDGLVAAQLVPGGPAVKAGVHPGDVLIGLNDVEVRDRQSFIPLLATHKPGETITVNLRRGTDYLSLPVVLGTHPPMPPGVAQRMAEELGQTPPAATTRPTTGPAAAATPAPVAASAVPAAVPPLAPMTAGPATGPTTAPTTKPTGR